MNVLIVLTSHDRLGDTGKKTGFWLEELAAQEASVSISGSGDMRVNVASSLRYRISGSGDILYDGSPHVSGGISGSGSVRGR